MPGTSPPIASPSALDSVPVAVTIPLAARACWRAAAWEICKACIAWIECVREACACWLICAVWIDCAVVEVAAVLVCEVLDADEEETGRACGSAAGAKIDCAQCGQRTDHAQKYQGEPCSHAGKGAPKSPRSPKKNRRNRIGSLSKEVETEISLSRICCGGCGCGGRAAGRIGRIWCGLAGGDDGIEQLVVVILDERLQLNPGRSNERLLGRERVAEAEVLVACENFRAEFVESKVSRARVRPATAAKPDSGPRAARARVPSAQRVGRCPCHPFAMPRPPPCIYRAAQRDQRSSH